MKGDNCVVWRWVSTKVHSKPLFIFLGCSALSHSSGVRYLFSLVMKTKYWKMLFGVRLFVDDVRQVSKTKNHRTIKQNTKAYDNLVSDLARVRGTMWISILVDL